jgi:hypothetical protein
MRAASEPRRCALIPQKAIIADGMKMAPDCMHVVDLPFCDDIRQPPPNVTNYVAPPKDAVEVRVPRSHPSPLVPPPLRTVGFNVEGLGTCIQQSSQVCLSCFGDFCIGPL